MLMAGRILVGLVSIFWLSIIGGFSEYKWERRPADWPNYEVRVLFLHKHIGFGNGLGAQLAAAQDEITAPKTGWKARLDQCHSNTLALSVALDRQSASVAAVGAEGARRTAEAERAVQASRTATQRAEAKARAILTHQPTGGDTCSRVLDVDRQFVEALR